MSPAKEFALIMMLILLASVGICVIVYACVMLGIKCTIFSVIDPLRKHFEDYKVVNDEEDFNENAEVQMDDIIGDVLDNCSDGGFVEQNLSDPLSYYIENDVSSDKGDDLIEYGGVYDENGEKIK